MKKYFVFILVLVLGVILAGCSKKASEVNQIKDNELEKNELLVRKINVAVESASKPLSFEDENGNVTGYEVELIKELDNILDEYEIVLEMVEAEAVQIGLETGKYAFVGGGAYKTPEREEKYLIPDAITGVSLINIYVRENDNSIKTLDDLVDKKVVPSSPNGGIYNLLTNYNKENDDKKIVIETAEGITLADRFKSVDTGEYDAIVLPNNLGFDEIKNALNLKIKSVEEPVKINPTYFLAAKDEKDLSRKIEEGLTILKENGKLSELSIKWFGEDTIKFYKD